MKTMTRDAFGAAREFLWLNARLIDRHRFTHLFEGGSAQPVLVALRGYQNPDGGFGHALEPDLRGPVSQPEPVEVALRVLDEVDAFDDPMVGAACDYLASVSAADGGVPFVLPSARAYPRAPWWQTDDDPPGTLIPTGSLAGLLHRHKIGHPWVDQATRFCWERIDAMEATSPYEAYAALTFLEHVPDRARAEAAFARLREAFLACVELDPHASGEIHFPLDFAPAPDRLARRLFPDDVMEVHLDAFVDAQGSDGGWNVNWQVWTPITGPEWRGWMTVEALRRLRAYGRLTVG